MLTEHTCLHQKVDEGKIACLSPTLMAAYLAIHPNFLGRDCQSQVFLHHLEKSLWFSPFVIHCHIL